MNLIGKGHTAEVFEYEDNKVLKLYYESLSDEDLKRELKNAEVATSFHLPVPKCYGVIEKDHRMGLIFDRMRGDNLIKCTYENKDVNFFIEHFVTLHKKILDCHTMEVSSYKEYLTRCIDPGNRMKPILVKEIAMLPDGYQLCHGDFHPQNILIDENGESSTIDLSNLCYGPQEFDIAISYLILCGVSEIAKNIPGEFGVAIGKVSQLYLEQMGVNYEKIERFVKVLLKVRTW